jgi:putative FmdB family regulatory protein
LPIYEYRCRNGHNFEVKQSMTDDPVEVCTQCGAPVERVFHPVAVHFKGSGFYTTDYGRTRGGGASESASSSQDNAKQDSKEAASAKSEGSEKSGASSGSSKPDSSGSSSSD